MNRKDPESLIASYQAGVRHPEASGMEHLNLLQIRSKLASLAAILSTAQSERLQRADHQLLASTNDFLRAIEQIADLSSWRAQEQVPPTHWWWYLDVIANLPDPILSETRQESMPKAEIA